MIGDAIRQRRKDIFMTQRELADKAGLAVSFVSDLENGKRGVGVGSLHMIARVLVRDCCTVGFDAKQRCLFDLWFTLNQTLDTFGRY